MTMKKIEKPEEIEPDTVVGNFSEGDLRVYRRANRKILGSRMAIQQAIEEISKAVATQSDIWEKYDIDEPTKEILVSRGLALSVNTRDGNVSVSIIDEKEKMRSLMPYLL